MCFVIVACSLAALVQICLFMQVFEENQQGSHGDHWATVTLRKLLLLRDTDCETCDYLDILI